jgi:hypothetical protein
MLSDTQIPYQRSTLLSGTFLTSYCNESNIVKESNRTEIYLYLFRSMQDVQIIPLQVILMAEICAGGFQYSFVVFCTAFCAMVYLW